MNSLKCSFHDTNKCVGCPIYETEKERALNRNNDPFDAAVDMWYYVDACQKNGGCYDPMTKSLTAPNPVPASY
ncbi:MAG: hypothetical protein II399_08080 [Lachnospiraceae bacterium]|nr:hypothetical protein [Lachnospiraceae bacterium]